MQNSGILQHIRSSVYRGTSDASTAATSRYLPVHERVGKLKGNAETSCQCWGSCSGKSFVVETIRSVPFRSLIENAMLRWLLETSLGTWTLMRILSTSPHSKISFKETPWASQTAADRIKPLWEPQCVTGCASSTGEASSEYIADSDDDSVASRTLILPVHTSERHLPAIVVIGWKL